MRLCRDRAKACTRRSVRPPLLPPPFANGWERIEACVCISFISGSRPPPWLFSTCSWMERHGQAEWEHQGTSGKAATPRAAHKRPRRPPPTSDEQGKIGGVDEPRGQGGGQPVGSSDRFQPLRRGNCSSEPVRPAWSGAGERACAQSCNPQRTASGAPVSCAPRAAPQQVMCCASVVLTVAPG